MQNKSPLSPVQVFQDVPADYAFKTMTMEAFPHSGQQLASVHPCKHASVMKKFIDRMEAAQADPEELAKAQASAQAGAKKKWGIGGMVRRVTGGGSVSTSVVEKGEGDEEDPKGVQVDFYLVIVSRHGERGATSAFSLTTLQFLKFIASIVPTIEVSCLEQSSGGVDLLTAKRLIVQQPLSYDQKRDQSKC